MRTDFALTGGFQEKLVQCFSTGVWCRREIRGSLSKALVNLKVGMCLYSHPIIEGETEMYNNLFSPEVFFMSS